MSTSPTPPPEPLSQPSSEPPILGILSQAASGLFFTSETDAPLTPFFWAQAGPEVSIAGVRRALSLAPELQIAEQSPEEFLAPASSEEEWQNADERATARRFQDLARVLRENLGEVKVLRVGEVSVDVYIVGRVEGGLAGLKTQVVET